MKISNNGLQQIVKREGVILHAYQDTVGVWTIGTGHTSAAGSPKVVPGMVISKADNDRILLKDLEPIEKQVNDTVKVPITQNQYDALVSIIFNVGPKFLNSTCMKLLNAGKTAEAANAIMLWNKPPEIIGRRATEKKQFLAPDGIQPKPMTPGKAVVTAGIFTGITSFITGHTALFVVAGALILAGGIYTYLEKRKSLNVG